MITPLSIQLADRDAERVRQSHALAIREIQDLPASSLRVVRDVPVINNNNVTIAHGLGRAPIFVGVSAVRWDKAPFVAPGTFLDLGTVDQAGNPIDRTKIVVLAANGFTSLGSVFLTIDVMFL